MVFIRISAYHLTAGNTENTNTGSTDTNTLCFSVLLSVFAVVREMSLYALNSIRVKEIPTYMK